MKGDFTRSTFRVENHYSSVRMQQGRLQLDADWNEQADIQRHLLQVQARDMIGLAGVSLADPSTALSFQIGVTDDGKDLTIAPGRIYVDGVLCELEPSSFLRFTLKQSNNQSSDTIEIEVSTLLLDGQELARGQWVELFETLPTDEAAGSTPIRATIETVDKTPRSSGFTISFKASTLNQTVPEKGYLRRILTWKTQLDLPELSSFTNASLTSDKGYLAYLDVWQRHLTAIEKPGLREPALNIPDTATRTKTVWQVKLLEPGDDTSDNPKKRPDAEQEQQSPRNAEQKRQKLIDDGQKALTKLQTRSARLKARVRPSLSQGGTSSTRRLDNQLYRVEIHTVGKVGEATFKWSRDNGAIASAIADLDDTNANVITIAPTGRDGSQLFAPNQWVEITDDVRELQEMPGTLVRLTAATTGTKLVFQKSKDSDRVNRTQFPNHYNPKVRRWDHTTPKSEIPTVADKWVPLGDEGIEVWFEAGSMYKTGDYWLIPARTVTNNIEWTRDSSGNPLPQDRDGPFHAYCRLAVVNRGDNGKFEAYDDRRQFAGLANTLPLSGGTITGALTVKKTLTAQQALIVGKMLTVSSGQITSPTHNLSLKVGEKNGLTISQETGNIGIGISNPTRPLHIDLPTDQTQALRVSQGNQYVDLGLQSSQFVGFQTSGIGYNFDKRLRVSGSDRFIELGMLSDKFVGFQTNGLGYKFDKPIVHNGSPQVISSQTIKENIVDFDSQEAAELLQALRPVKFTYRTDKNKHIQAGFLAEEVPPLVASVDHRAIRLMEIIAILTQNVKKHEQTITALSQKVTQQQAMIDSLIGDVLDMWISKLS